MFRVGTFTLSSTGIKTFTGMGFQPKMMQFTVSQIFATPQNTVAHLSTGFTDGITSRSHAILADATGNHTRRHPNPSADNYCVVHYERVGGTVTKIISAKHVSFNPDGFTVDCDAANVNYTIDYMAWG